MLNTNTGGSSSAAVSGEVYSRRSLCPPAALSLCPMPQWFIDTLLVQLSDHEDFGSLLVLPLHQSHLQLQTAGRTLLMSCKV